MRLPTIWVLVDCDLDSVAADVGGAGDEIARAGHRPADRGAVRLEHVDAGAAVGHGGRAGGVGADVVALHGRRDAADLDAGADVAGHDVARLRGGAADQSRRSRRSGCRRAS